MARLSVVDKKTSPMFVEIYAHTTKTRGHISNILKSFSNAPEGLRRLTAFGEYARYQADIPHRVRELVILTIACGNQYAWTHLLHLQRAHVSLALDGASSERRDKDGAGSFFTLGLSVSVAVRH